MKKYIGISVKCGVRNPFNVQDEIENLLAKSFKSFKRDGGGMMVSKGEPIRDIYFSIDHNQINKAKALLKAKGYNLV